MRSLGQNIVDMIQAPKTAAVVSTATLTTGLTTILDLIPPNIGKLASLSGFLLSVVLICIHIRKARSEERERALRIAILEYEKNAVEQDFKMQGEEDT